MKHNRIILIITITLAIAAISWGVIRAIGLISSYGQPGIVDTCLSGDGSRLYVSYYFDEKVVEIDTSTMQELRSFSVTEPGMMAIDEDEIYLYVISLWPGKINRIRLSDGHKDTINLSGEAYNLALDPAGDRMWVVHRTWPVRGDIVDTVYLGTHPGTGFLTQINTSTFNIESTVDIWKLPMTVWYSPISENVYVYHEGIYREYDESTNTLSLSSILLLGNEVSVHSVSGEIPVYTGYIIAGMYDSFDDLPIDVCKWSDDGRYWAVPSLSVPVPEFSLRVFDTMDNSVVLDLYIPSKDAEPMNIGAIDRAPGSNYLWAALMKNRTPEGMDEEGRYVARIDITTYTWDIFPVYEASTYFGAFSVAPDDSCLYLTQPETGEIIVWSPE